MGFLELVAVGVLTVDFVLRRGHDIWTWVKGAEKTVVDTASNEVKKL